MTIITCDGVTLNFMYPTGEQDAESRYDRNTP